MDYRYQAEQYRSGRYSQYVIHALKHREEIFDILDSFRTQEATEDERRNYYPVGIYCSKCGKDTTKITSLSDDCINAEYTCECGHHGQFDFMHDFNCKLAWKIDWPMRWKVEGVDFEPGGKDHASPTGSYQTSRIISEKIFGFEAPLFQGYEFIGIKGTTGKMSGSSGLNLTPDTLLKLYDPEIILWLYSKTEPTKAFNFCFDDEILRQYFEFDRMMSAYTEGRADEHIASIMEGSVIDGRSVETKSEYLVGCAVQGAADYGELCSPTRVKSPFFVQLCNRKGEFFYEKQKDDRCCKPAGVVCGNRCNLLVCLCP